MHITRPGRGCMVSGTRSMVAHKKAFDFSSNCDSIVRVLQPGDMLEVV